MVVNHSHWRMQAIQEMSDASEVSIHYSALYTLGTHDLKRLQSRILKFIEETRSAVVESKEDEELSVFTCDFCGRQFAPVDLF